MGMRHRLYVHIVWTTREREPLIDADVARFLCRYLRAIAQQERSRVLEIGMVATHVHLLLTLHPLTNIPRLVMRLKGGSATLANREGHADLQRPLRWADGYSIASVSPGLLERTREYLRHQPQHHPAEAIVGWRGAYRDREEPPPASDLRAPSGAEAERRL